MSGQFEHTDCIVSGRSPATNLFIATGEFYLVCGSVGALDWFLPGCYVSIGRLDEVQGLLDKISHTVNIWKMMVPAEVLIKKKCMSRISQTQTQGSIAWLKVELYKRKQVRRSGDPHHYMEAIRINPVEGLCLIHAHTHVMFWQQISRICHLSVNEPILHCVLTDSDLDIQ